MNHLFRSSTALRVCLCALLSAPLLTACEKKASNEPSPQAAVAASDVTVQDGRLVFASRLAWSKTVSKLANLDQQQLATWQSEFTGFVPLTATATEAAIQSKPVEVHPVDRYFLALLNRDGMYQVGNEVHIFAKNVLYTLANPDEATIQRVKQAITDGTVKASGSLKISVFSEHPPKDLRLETTGSTTNSSTTNSGLDYYDDGVQYQWYQGNNFYFKYRTRFGVRSTYNYAGFTAAEVYLSNTLQYSKAGVSWWAQAGDNANKSFSTMTIAWDGNGQLPSPYANGAYGPTYGNYTIAGASRSDNQDLYLSCGIISADYLAHLTLTGTVSNSVNWNSSQSRTQALNYAVANFTM